MAGTIPILQRLQSHVLPARQQFALNVLVRLLALFAFAALIYRIEYLPAKQNGYVLDGETRERLLGSIRAANGGHPFYFYLGEEVDPGVIQLEYLYPWYNTTEDYGLHILVVAISSVGRALFGDDFLVTTATPFQAIWGLLVLTALVFLLPNVPLPLSLAGVLMLLVGIIAKPIDFETSPEMWTGYMPMLVSMLVITAHLPKRGFWNGLYLLALASLIGFAQFMRQESLGVVYLSAPALLGVAWLVALVGYFVIKDRALWRRVILLYAGRVSLAAFAMLLSIFAAQAVLRVFYAAAWDKPYSQTEVAQHGMGHSLYIGLGYVSNPYNIVWLDPMGYFHARLYDPRVVTTDWSVDYENALLGHWREIIIESPWLLLANWRAKAAFMDHFLGRGEPPYPTAFLYPEQSNMMIAFYRLAQLGLLLGVPLLIYRPKPAALVVYLAAFGVIAGASAGPLLGFPSYLFGMQGVLVSIVLLLPTGLVFLARGKDALWDHIAPPQQKCITIWALAALLGMILLGGALGGGWLWLRWRIHQDHLAEIKHADPLAEIMAKEFRYTPLFNDLPQADQEKIIETLRASDSPQVALPTEPIDPDAYFRPIVAVLSEGQLHVIYWLGDGFPGPVKTLNQARTNALLQVCVSCESLAQQFGYDDAATLYTFLNDSDWANRYRMVSYTADAQALHQADWLLMGAQRLTDWGGGATYFGYQVEDLGSVKMRFKAP